MIGTQDNVSAKNLLLDIVSLAYGVEATLDSTTRPESFGILSERAIAKALMPSGIVHPRSVGKLTGEIANHVQRFIREWKEGGHVEGEFFERIHTFRDLGMSIVVYHK